jgi:hypothetical protein
MIDPSSPEERERIRKLLEKTVLGQKVKQYSETWIKDQELREKEIEERKEVSVFEEPEVKGRLTHPVSEYDKDPKHRHFTIKQVETVKRFLDAGLSVRDVPRACHVINDEPFDISKSVVAKISKEKKIQES